MKPARIIVLVVALAAGGIAALLAGGGSKKQAPAEPVKQVDTVDVLVAKSDINMGQVVAAGDLRWQDWPRESANAGFVRKSDKPNGIQEVAGSIARAQFVAGEPIREAKLIKGNGAGFLAAMLPSGMRAVSTEISPETGAGGFILPNDHVDVILTRRDSQTQQRAGVDSHRSETILHNVRVLAIDQTIEEKNGQKVVVGKTATLELVPRQAETLVLSRQLGTLSLVLRSLADANKTVADDDSNLRQRGNGEINMVRFGATTQTTSK
jgi:pilus assembly protein CpaB